MAQISERDAVTNLQRYLRQLSYTEKSIPPLPIDGIFENATREALIAFQRLYSLSPSGVADRETWNKLYEEYLKSISKNQAPRMLDLFPRVPDDYSLRRGDEYFLVNTVQFLLNELRIIYDSFIPLVISGIFDEATETNVMDFQKKNKLDATGRVDKETWNKIIEAYENYAGGYLK
ncbi:MAG: peptidoglycan-binding protein [Clostridia bacterium]|nr:peptidoglycan-binding protein [Clostridia bacterium]